MCECVFACSPSPSCSTLHKTVYLGGGGTMKHFAVWCFAKFRESSSRFTYCVSLPTCWWRIWVGVGLSAALWSVVFFLSEHSVCLKVEFTLKILMFVPLNAKADTE